MVQNKLYYAIHRPTAAELIVERADHRKEHIGLTTWKMDYAERQARRYSLMTMEDWAKSLDVFLASNEEEVLSDRGRVSVEIAKSFAESEFEKYRVIQDGLYQISNIIPTKLCGFADFQLPPN